VVRCEEYSPSRRSSAPIAPGVLHALASHTIFRLYSIVHRRRVAFAALGRDRGQPRIGVEPHAGPPVTARTIPVA
jgi:hypothetical protein